jgi:DNA polymerase
VNLWCDTETYSRVPIQHGTWRYAEDAEVILFTWALDDGPVNVWDPTESPTPPATLRAHLENPDVLVWFQNGDKFDWPVLKHAMPWIHAVVPVERRRDTMVQAYCHGLPGGLEKMSEALGVHEDKKKLKIGKGLITLFCKPDPHGARRDRTSHPEQWQQFKADARRDIVAMRECHARMPMWNYKGKQLDLWMLDQKINERGMQMDLVLAHASIMAVEREQRKLKAKASSITDGAVESTTQRDVLLAYILEAHGVSLPDMQSDTLERRLRDPELPEAVKELLRVRLEATTTSTAKYRTAIKATSRDGRLRGCMQFRGAARTGRVGHRLFQPGNLPRPSMKPSEITWAIELIKLQCAHLVYDNVMKVASNAVRGLIIPAPGRRLAIADLKNIEGRVGAWLAREEWKLQAFRDYDAGIGADLYILAYANSFNVPVESVPKKGTERQIGKVEELMLQYGGGVGAFLTGAATYGIELDKMTEQVWDILPGWALDEASNYLMHLHAGPEAVAFKKHERINKELHGLQITIEEADELKRKADEHCEVMKLKARLGLAERTFIACDSIKRMWRKRHPAIASYWKELEGAARTAIYKPGETVDCRRVKIRRDGAWLRIGLPSGRALCYPHPKVDDEGKISYMGVSQYTKKWERIHTYGGKLFENITQAVACDQLIESGLGVEEAGFEIVLSVHDEYVTDVPKAHDNLTAELLSELMCTDLGWNEGSRQPASN